MARRKNRSTRSDVCEFQKLEAKNLLAGGIVFQDSFENGLSTNWQIPLLDIDSRVQIRNLVSEGLLSTPPAMQFAEDGNPNSLVFDSINSDDSQSDLGVAILSVDLSGLDDARLIFHQLEEDDENQSLPDGAHSVSEPADGVAVSNDGVNWYSIVDIVGDDINRSGDGLWRFMADCPDALSGFRHRHHLVSNAQLGFWYVGACRRGAVAPEMAHLAAAQLSGNQHLPRPAS